MYIINDNNKFIDKPSKRDMYRTFSMLLILEVMLLVNSSLLMRPYRSCSSSSAARNNKRHMINAHAIGQFPELPSGCEPAAAAMLLNWAGVNASKEDLARTIPKALLPAAKNGVMEGGNPHDVFLGDPFSRKGLGAYHEVIAGLINKYLPGQADDVTGASFEYILSIIDSDRPVIVWSTRDLAEPVSTITWYDEKDEKINWKTPEHVYLIVGYDGSEVFVNDPYTGRMKSYPLPRFEKRWEQMGRQAVTILAGKQTDLRTAYSFDEGIKGTASEIDTMSIVNNIGVKVTALKDTIGFILIGLKKINITSKLSRAADALYNGIIYLADNM